MANRAPSNCKPIRFLLGVMLAPLFLGLGGVWAQDPVEDEVPSPTDILLGDDAADELAPETDPVAPESQPSAPSQGASGVERSQPGQPSQRTGLYTEPFGSTADDRTITGLVTDEKSDTPLSGAVVLVSGFPKGTLTNDLGSFVIDFDLKPGFYNVTVSREGYFSQSKRVEVKDSRSTRENFVLKEKPIGEDVHEMDPFIVVEELAEDEQGRIEMTTLGSGTTLDIFGSEQFSKTGSGDVAAAATRIVGVSVVGGRYAVIRGLGDRYSNTTLNGTIIPSADPSRKAVQLDLFPSDLVEDLVVYKTFRPDLSAEFAGGSIDIRTKRFPSKRILEFGIGLGFNNATKEGVLFLNRDRRIDWLGRTGDGFPDGLLPISGENSFVALAGGATTNPDNIPDGNPAKPILLERQRIAIEQQRIVHRNGSFRTVATNIEPNTSFDLTFGDTWEGAMGEVGTVIAFTQGRKFDFIEDIEIGRGSIPSGEFSPIGLQIQDKYSEEVTFGTLMTLGFRPVENHEIGFTYFYNRTAKDTIRFGRRVASSERATIASQIDGFPGTPIIFDGNIARAFQAFDEVGLVDRSLKTYQVGGEHQLADSLDIEFDWAASFSTAIEDRPDQRTQRGFEADFSDPTLPGVVRQAQDPNAPGQQFRDAVVDASRGSIRTVGNLLGGNLQQSFREFLRTEEDGKHIKGDLTIPFYFFDDRDNSLKMKLGVSRFDRDRQVRGRFFQYTQGSNLGRTISPVTNPQAGIDFYEDFDNEVDVRFDGIQPRNGSAGVVVEDLTTRGNTIRNVDARSTIESRYLMGTFEWKNVSLVAGARYEEEARDYFIIPGLNPSALTTALQSPGPQLNEYWLPAISATIGFGPKIDLGAGPEEVHKVTIAYGETIARPTFYEFAPIRTVDQATGIEIRGNPSLVDTQITNFDFRWEWFPNQDDKVSLSLFHKSMDNPIVQTVGSLAGSGQFQSFANSPAGTIQGIEVELGKQINPFWRFDTNLTYLDSFIEPVISSDTGLPVGSASVFEGQPEWIYNANLGFEHEDWGISANLVYNYTSQILTNVSESQLIPNVFKEGSHSLDLILQKEFKSGVALKFTARNLFDWEQRQFYEGQELTYEGFSTGRAYSVSLGIDF